jgi:hypothetical protein
MALHVQDNFGLRVRIFKNTAIMRLDSNTLLVKVGARTAITLCPTSPMIVAVVARIGASDAL